MPWRENGVCFRWRLGLGPIGTGTSIVRNFCAAIACLLVVGATAFSAPGSAAEKKTEHVTVSHGWSIYGPQDLKYPPGFKHFDYVNPDAPKGGTLHLDASGAFDSLNPFIVKGQWAGSVYYTLDSLMVDAHDEPFSKYGLLVDKVELPDDISWVIFDLRPEARWHDGVPITADDVVYTFNKLVKEGKPLYRFYYANVAKVEALGPHRVKFTFNQKNNRELPGIVSQMMVIPKHYWEKHNFADTTLDPPLGSGPYKITKVDPGREITLERVKDYWGKDLPVNRGMYNFDKIVIDYYRDDNVAFEAFKAGKVDLRQETSKNWATAYNFPAYKQGRVKKLELPKNDENTMLGFAFNIRRDKFKDPRVREALSDAFDFEWLNKNIFYGLYTRTRSYFRDSELSARGLPSPAELKLLEPFRDQLDPRVFTKAYEPPSTKPPSSLRQNLRKAVTLLKEAGWEIKNGKLTQVSTGKVMTINFIYVQPDSERVIAPFADNLKKIGVQTSMRQIDASQAIQLLNTRQFDMYIHAFRQSHSPGNEQREYFGSKSAGVEGSENWVGIKNPAVDAMINKIIFAQSRQQLITACRAMDRILQWSFYAIPMYHSDYFRLGVWDKFGRPKHMAKFALGPDYIDNFLYTWWIDPAKERALLKRGGE